MRTLAKACYDYQLRTSVGEVDISFYDFIPLGRQNLRWVDNIKMDLEEIGLGGVDRIGLAEDGDKRRALMNVVMNLRVP
jgi:hypothetical protein